MIVPDGSRRWAKKHGVSLLDAYDAVARKTADFCAHLNARGGIDELLVCVASVNNYGRSEEQVKDFNLGYSRVAQYSKIPLSITVAGNFDAMGVYADHWRELVRNNREGFPLRLLVAWSMDDEVSRIAHQARDQEGPLTIKDVAALSDIPDEVDVWIKTGGNRRVSAMHPLFSPYMELVFLDDFFQDLTLEDLDDSISNATNRRKLFGM
ncbi:undecaprenyl diphosphate synthase family protein [Actinokineospora iranica]|nr:undecaprenyl diphosphate synthase family protein [Actinokineospora iranica]